LTAPASPLLPDGGRPVDNNPDLDYSTHMILARTSDIPSPNLAELSAAGIRAFTRIAQLWRLSVDEQLQLLGEPARSTFFAWRKHPERASLPKDTLERISNLLGIYKSLQILFPDTAAADAWIRKPNSAPIFGGRSALERMLGGNVSDLNAVRRYLDSVRGGGWS
jgi:hypothetical protein